MNGASRLFGVISECHDFLLWIHHREDPEISAMPDEFKGSFKQLDKLGIVFKRNNRSIGIRWQRLRRLIEREDSMDTVPYDPDALLKYFGERCLPDSTIN